jgi:BON domain
MSEYEDRYPDARGRREETDTAPQQRHFLGLGLPRQLRDSAPVVISTPREVASIPAGPSIPGDPPIKVVDIADLPPREPRHAAQPHTERPRQPLVERSPREICEDVAEQLAASPFIDSSDISITVDDSEVTLDGTINSLIAVSLARALALNVPGVSRAQVRLRVVQAPKRYATS